MPKLGPFWTIANVFSLCRPLVAGLAVYLMFTGGSKPWIVFFVLLSGLTDWLDGAWARRTQTVSEWGKMLDPICDKIAIAGMGTAMVLNELLPLWFMGVIVLRDLLIVAGSAVLARQIKEIQMSNWAGKAAVTAIGVTIILGILEPDQSVLQFCIWSSVILMSVSFWLYGGRFIELAQKPTEE